MKTFLVSIFGNYLGTLIMSLVPLIELKGGIVFARGADLNFLTALLLAYVGSTIVFVPIFFLLRPILNLLKKIKFINNFALKIENFFSEKANDTLQKRQNQNGRNLTENALKKLGVFIFVAIPLPMTGVWTGTAVAVFLDLKFKDVILPVTLGNLVAGLIISVLAQICLWISGTTVILDYILWGLFALALILFIITVIKIVKSGKKEVK